MTVAEIQTLPDDNAISYEGFLDDLKATLAADGLTVAEAEARVGPYLALTRTLQTEELAERLGINLKGVATAERNLIEVIHMLTDLKNRP